MCSNLFHVMVYPSRDSASKERERLAAGHFQTIAKHSTICVYRAWCCNHRECPLICTEMHVLSPRRLGAGVIFVHECDNLTLVVDLP